MITYHNDITAIGVYSYNAGIYNRLFLPLVFKRAERITVTRTHFTSRFLEKYGEKLIYIPPGVNTDQFRPADYPKIGDIFFLSVLDEYHRYKGINILFSAVHQLKDAYPGLKVIVGGSGIQSDYYKKGN